MNLYSKVAPAGRLMVVVHSGLDDVYCEAESAGALDASQPPSCAMDPAILTVWPTAVVVLERNVTATLAAGVAQLVGGGLAGVLVVVVVGGDWESGAVILMSAQVR